MVSLGVRRQTPHPSSYTICRALFWHKLFALLSLLLAVAHASAYFGGSLTSWDLKAVWASDDTVAISGRYGRPYGVLLRAALCLGARVLRSESRRSLWAASASEPCVYSKAMYACFSPECTVSVWIKGWRARTYIQPFNVPHHCSALFLIFVGMVLFAQWPIRR